jgi:hypothetical protein
LIHNSDDEEKESNTPLSGKGELSDDFKIRAGSVRVDLKGEKFDFSNYLK